jgi:hypothetical protein
MGILVETSPAKTIICRTCDKECSIEPSIETLPQTGEIVGLHLCKTKGLIKVDPERLRQWEIVPEKLPKEKARRKDDNTPKINRKQKIVNDKTLLISTFLHHHKFDMSHDEQDELHYEPATQEMIRKQLNWSQSKVSRVLTKSFPPGFWKKYKAACKNETLKGFLQILDNDQTNPEPIDYRPQHPTEREEKEAWKYH